MSTFLVSVIVPIFNNEEYLEQCLDSIIGQTYKRLEIILVDDGSTDNSGEICDRYLKRDKRIQVYHRQNHGLVESRKFGLHCSHGEFVTFVDSDDWIELDMYENMLSKISGKVPDIITSGIICESTIKTFEIDVIKEGYYERNEIQNKILPFMMFDRKSKRRGITGAVWNKIFSKNLLSKIVYKIDQRVTYGEDATITYPAFAMAENAIIINKAWYHYRLRYNSMAHTYTIESFEKIRILKDELQKSFIQNGIYNEMEGQIKQYILQYLQPAIERVYGMAVQQIQYFFPYDSIIKGSKIIIYGAGNVGKSYQNCLCNSQYVNVVEWVDKRFDELRKQGYDEVDNPDNIFNKEFEYILIAIENKKTALQIKEKLIQRGIHKEKIIWVEPRKLKLMY